MSNLASLSALLGAGPLQSLKIHFLDVGHGDCTIIDFPNHLTMVDINNCKALSRQTEEELTRKYRPVPAVPTVPLLGYGSLAGNALAGLGGPPRLTPEPPNPLLLAVQQWDAKQRLQAAKDRLTNPIDYLKAHFTGRGIFRYVQSHPDMDHMAGLYRLCVQEKISIENFWDTRHCVEKDEDAMRTGEVNPDIRDWKTYQFLRKSRTNPTVLCLKAGDTGNYWTHDGINIWAPESHDHATDPDASPNDFSYVLQITFGRCRIVLGGDADESTWQLIYDRFEGKLPKIHLLKASHHGRKSGYHAEAVKAMAPEVTVLSVAELKSKHDAEASYEEHSNKGCFSTLEHGDIVATCWSDGDIWLNNGDGAELVKTGVLR